MDGDRRKRTQSLLTTLRRTLDALAVRRGRKSILLFARGFLQDSDTTARDVAAAARAANAAVYFVDARGLQGQPAQFSAANAGTPNPSDFGRTSFEASVLDSSGAQALADETGGTSFRNTNDLGGAAARVAGESRAYYLVGFHPRSDKAATAWRKLSVEVSRPGVTVRTRKGYALRAATGEGARADAPASGKASAVMAAALDSVPEADGIPARARAFAFEARPKGLTRVLVAVEFDARSLSFERVTGGAPRARRGGHPSRQRPHAGIPRAGRGAPGARARPRAGGRWHASSSCRRECPRPASCSASRGRERWARPPIASRCRAPRGCA